MKNTPKLLPKILSSSVLIMMLTTSRNISKHVGAYTFPRKRPITNVNIGLHPRGKCETCGGSWGTPSDYIMPEVSRRSRDSSLAMSLDSRELRFFSSSISSTRISRAMSKSGGSGSSSTGIVSNARTFSKSEGAMKDTTFESINRVVRNHDLLDSLAPPPSMSIYSNGLAALVNSFESDIIRAFSDPTTSSGFAFARGYSTSSLLLTSLEGTLSDPRMKRPIQIDLTDEEEELFELLRTVTKESGMKSTLRVAGGWVRDKILASNDFLRVRKGSDFSDGNNLSATSTIPHFLGNKLEIDTNEVTEMNRITSKFKCENKAPHSESPVECLSVNVPVDIDIALDDKLGREFADELNQWLSNHGRETHSVGVVLKNPEKSKHLETATMRINNYWIDFVNLRAEEYTSDSRIPDLMRIGTAEEDAFRRDLTINSLFYNINDGVVEDMTGRGLEDLMKGIVATPLPPLTTLLDDPLRALRSVRFAARLRFFMADSLKEAVADTRVKLALEQKVSRERVGSEVDLMLKSRDPVGAMRLLINLGLIDTVFPLSKSQKTSSSSGVGINSSEGAFDLGLSLLSITHDHLCACKNNPPFWCEAKRALEAGAVNGVGKEETRLLTEDEDARRLLWYAAFIKPIRDQRLEVDVDENKKPRKSKRSFIFALLVDELKRPCRDADSVDKIMRGADGFSDLVSKGADVSSLTVLLSDAHVIHCGSEIICSMNNRAVDPNTEDDPIWTHCMEFRQDCATVLKRIGPLWRASFILSLCEQLLNSAEDEMEYVIEGDVIDEVRDEVLNGILEKYDAFAAAIMNLGLIGIWNQQPLVNGEEIKHSILPKIPGGPAFRDVMDEQTTWITTHPGGCTEKLVDHLRSVFPDLV